MRKFFTLVLACIAINSYSQRTLKAVQNGDWEAPSTWEDVTKVTGTPATSMPEDMDKVEIPKDVIVTVKGDIYKNTKPNLTIQISGTLQFQPSGQLDLGINSTIQLTDNSATITSTNNSASELILINNVVKYAANKDQTLSGPAYASSTTGTAPGGFTVVTLPIKLQSFTAQAQNSRVVLKWTTAEEINNSHFEVEKSTNARQWNLLQRVAAEGQPADYTYSDVASASGDVYYRLKSVDLDGKSEYSHIVKVGHSRSLTAYVSPNPARTQVTVSLSTPSAAPVQVQLVAPNGQVVKEGFFAKGSALIHLGLQGTRAGIYTLVLREGSSVVEASQLLVQ